MNQIKLMNYTLIVLCIISICLGIYYFYNFIIHKTEPFEVINGLSSQSLNLNNLEPRIKDGNVNVNIEERYEDSFKYEFLTSNNIGLYAIKNNMSNILYYCTDDDIEFNYIIFKFNRPSTKNPSFENKNDGCDGTLLSSSPNSLWYYNNFNNTQNINIDCIYYTQLETNGKPKILEYGNDIKTVNFNCLRLPLLSNLSLPSTTPIVTDSMTKPSAFYDRIKYIAVNDDVLFAVGCEILQLSSQEIHYCKLTKGIPSSAIVTEASVWKTIDIPFHKDNIKTILINDNIVFIVKFTFNNDNTHTYNLFYR